MFDLALKINQKETKHFVGSKSCFETSRDDADVLGRAVGGRRLHVVADGGRVQSPFRAFAQNPVHWGLRRKCTLSHPASRHTLHILSWWFSLQFSADPNSVHLFLAGHWPSEL